MQPSQKQINARVLHYPFSTFKFTNKLAKTQPKAQTIGTFAEFTINQVRYSSTTED